MKTRGRFIAILAALSLLLAMLPAAPAVAVQGDIEFVLATDLGDDVDAYTANTVAGESFNIVTLRVDDSDLDAASLLASDFEILAIADGVRETFAVDNPPIDAVSSAFDIQDGVAYFTAVSVDRTEVTLHTARGEDFTSLLNSDDLETAPGDLTGATLAQTGDDAPGQGGPITAIRVEVADNADADATDVVVILSGTRVDPTTLATTAAAITAEAIDLTAAADPQIFTLANSIADTDSAGDIDAADVTVTFTDGDDGTDGGPIGATVTSIDAELGTITVDFTDGTSDGVPVVGDTLTVAYDSGEAINIIVNTATADALSANFYLGSVDANIYEANSTTGDGGDGVGVIGGYDIEYFETRVIAAVYTFDVANTTDYEDSESVTQQSVNLRSSSNSTGVDLTLTEVDPADNTVDPDSGVFTGVAALISEDDLDTITAVIADLSLDTDGTPTADDIDDLIAALDALDPDGPGDVASTWVTETIAALADVTGTDIIDDLLDITLEVDHDDTLTASYDDQSDIVDTDTATIDLEAPVISNVSPADGDFTRDETPRITATVIDEDSGVDLAAAFFEVTVDGDDVTTDVSTDPILHGFDIEFIAGATELGATPGSPPASYDWTLNISDEVGNRATTNDDGTDEILFTGDDDPITFTIDTVDPDLDTAETGIGLMLDVDDDDRDGETDDYVEFADPGWIKLTFDELVDSDSVQSSDFDVTGSSEPDDAITSEGEDISSALATGTHDGAADAASLTDSGAALVAAGVEEGDVIVNLTDGSSASIDDVTARAVTAVLSGGSGNDWDVGDSYTIFAEYTDPELFVYLQVADLAADATPDIDVVDDVDDLAGNSLDDLTGVDAVEADDTIRPTLTISLSATLGADEADITITVSSDEDLDNIDVLVTNEETGGDPTKVTMVRVGTTDVWNGDFEIGDSSPFTVDATGTDTSGNDGTEDDIFEGDITAPTAAVLANTVDIDVTGSPDVEEGAVWIVSTFTEDDEYADVGGDDGDTHDKVVVTAVSLEDEDGVAITEDVADLFTDDDETFTLAIILTPGAYTFSISAEDDAGNEVESGDLDFDVTERTPFDLDLLPGVNLVSIPGDPVGDGGNINVLFEDLPVTTVTTYDRVVDLAGGNPWLTSTLDAETGLFTGDIAVLEPGKAYFVTATASTTVEVDIAPMISAALPPVMQVRRGFNIIGYWSVEGDLDETTSADADAYLGSIIWTVAYSFDPTPGTGWQVIRPDFDPTAGEELTAGEGYLVYVTQDGTLTP